MHNYKITAFSQQASISKEYFPKGIMKQAGNDREKISCVNFTR